MGKSVVHSLPVYLRAWLDNAIVNRSHTYAEMSEELTKKGHPVSLSTLHRYGQKIAAAVDVIGAAPLQLGTAADNPELRKLVIEYGALSLQREIVLARAIDLYQQQMNESKEK